MREKVAASLQAAGFLSGVAAGFTVSAGLGLMIAAVGLVLFGLAVERG